MLQPFARINFRDRHIGSDSEETNKMLQFVGADSIDELIQQTVPDSIRNKNPLNIPAGKSEYQFLQDFKNLMLQNQVFKSYIGQGYFNTITPNVILRNILENPGWYTAYTPYQAEIAQGRLEMLINFQSMIIELTGMEIANAALLDEATAAAEAMTMLYAAKKGAKKDANTFVVSKYCFPQTIDVLKSRAIPVGIELVITDNIQQAILQPNVYGCLIQSPDNNGEVTDFTDFIAVAKSNEVAVAFATDLMASVLLKTPGAMGADVVIGSTQRFGVPMGFGGPHAAFFATKDIYKRIIPGRIIGVSVDANGQKAYRMALQTREQHIRREKATSNICTSQVLLAVMAAAYAVYHGETGLKLIANAIHAKAVMLENALAELNIPQVNKNYFDTLKFRVDGLKELIKPLAEQMKFNFRYEENYIIIAVDETTVEKDIREIVSIFSKLRGMGMISLSDQIDYKIDTSLLRKDSFLQHDVFKVNRSEHAMLRYLKKLENKDLSLTHSMISLGSCTMKLNATAEMIPVTWNEVANIHPFAPQNQVPGYLKMIEQLEAWLCEVTGFAAVSLQPNSGAQGEYAGLLVIRAYHEARGEGHRHIALIPSSAHGTNPASAVMAGMKVVVVNCDEKGNIDVEDLKAKANQYGSDLSCLMVTYPSTHGVFEESILDICSTIHQYGGQVYMDGANMNAQVGLTSPGNIGADVCHLNLHKTFSIPHGGGGPGVGPIGVAAHLAPYLPGHTIVPVKGDKAINAVSAAPYGSAAVLPISYAYISLMGGNGLKEATMYAILKANYMKAKLEKHFPILYTGKNNRCAHEFIVDCRAFKQSCGVEVEDIAKRLMDYGFHAPTVSFPVPGTLMIEPTESESLDELDRFCDALIAIREEIQLIESGVFDKQDNVLKRAPHTAAILLAEEWTRPYSKIQAAYPLPYVKDNKFWPSVSRIDSAYGDRNLVCSCAPIEAYAE